MKRTIAAALIFCVCAKDAQARWSLLPSCMRKNTEVELIQQPAGTEGSPGALTRFSDGGAPGKEAVQPAHSFGIGLPDSDFDDIFAPESHEIVIPDVPDLESENIKMYRALLARHKAYLDQFQGRVGRNHHRLAMYCALGSLDLHSYLPAVHAAEDTAKRLADNGPQDKYSLNIFI